MSGYVWIWHRHTVLVALPTVALLVRVRKSGFCWTIWIRFFYGCTVVAVPFILYLVRFCSPKPCTSKKKKYEYCCSRHGTFLGYLYILILYMHNVRIISTIVVLESTQMYKCIRQIQRH